MDYVIKDMFVILSKYKRYEDIWWFLVMNKIIMLVCGGEINNSVSSVFSIFEVYF